MKNKRLLVFLLSLLEEEDIVHVFIFFSEQERRIDQRRENGMPKSACL